MLYLIMSFIYKEAMSAFIEAYREYLERMYDESDELAIIDELTVPLHVNYSNPILLEWGEVG